ncbi:hypothetical protein SNEBB_002809 [Seison nebaliae]|nr:hypothetical protein SNEBB_002809 [Seison nebaliae]
MSEVEKSKIAHENGDGKNEETIFDLIIEKKIAANIIKETDEYLAFHDVNPQAPVHFLVIPKKRIKKLSLSNEKDNDLLGTLLGAARDIGKELKLDKGYRVVINDGEDGAQSVFHLHIHVMGKRQMTWPPG